MSLEKEVQTSAGDVSPFLQLVWTTFANQDEAKPIVKILLEEQLIVCAWMSPKGGLSIYQWQGNYCEEAEIAVVFKILSTQQPAFESRLSELHPYDIPAIITVDADKVLPAYLKYATK